MHTDAAIDEGRRYGNSCTTGSCDVSNPYTDVAGVVNAVSDFINSPVSSALGDGFTEFGGGDAGGGGASNDW